MGIPSINSYNQISFTAQQKKSQKVMRIPCRVKKTTEIDNSIQKAEQQKQLEPIETFDSYAYDYKRNKTKEELIDGFLGIGYIASIFAIALALATEKSNKEKTYEVQPTHPYSISYQHESTTPNETLPIILETVPDEIFEIIPEEPNLEETNETIPQEEKDILNIKGTQIAFDSGTLHKKDENKFDGLIDGYYSILSEDEDGIITLEKYEGLTSNSDLIQKTTYNKDGKIIKICTYTDGKIATVKNYTYSENLKIENETIWDARNGQIDEIITKYGLDDNDIISREFKSDDKIVATFDFSADTVTIGSEKNKELDVTMFLLLKMPISRGGETHKFILDSNSFKYNEAAFGSNKYTAKLDGYKIAFDVLKDGICVEYLDDESNVIKSEKYNTEAELIK